MVYCNLIVSYALLLSSEVEQYGRPEVQHSARSSGGFGSSNTLSSMKVGVGNTISVGLPRN